MFPAPSRVAFCSVLPAPPSQPSAPSEAPPVPRPPGSVGPSASGSNTPSPITGQSALNIVIPTSETRAYSRPPSIPRSSVRRAQRSAAILARTACKPASATSSIRRRQPRSLLNTEEITHLDFQGEKRGAVANTRLSASTSSFGTNWLRASSWIKACSSAAIVPMACRRGIVTFLGFTCQCRGGQARVPKSQCVRRQFAEPKSARKPPIVGECDNAPVPNKGQCGALSSRTDTVTINLENAEMDNDLNPRNRFSKEMEKAQ